MPGQFAPQPEGTRPTDIAASGLKTHQLRVTGAKALSELTGDYAFFNHGCFFTWGGLDVDPVEDFVIRHADQDCLVFHMDFPRPIFHGIPKPGRFYKPAEIYNHRLFAVPLPYWDALRAELMIVSAVDRARRSFHRSVTQEIDIVDPLSLQSLVIAPPLPPTVPVTVFGVDGNKHHIVWQSNAIRYDSPAHTKHLPLRDESLKLAGAILAGEDKPMRSIQPEPRVESQFVPPEAV